MIFPKLPCPSASGWNCSGNPGRKWTGRSWEEARVFLPPALLQITISNTDCVPSRHGTGSSFMDLAPMGQVYCDSCSHKVVPDPGSGNITLCPSSAREDSSFLLLLNSELPHHLCLTSQLFHHLCNQFSALNLLFLNT